MNKIIALFILIMIYSCTAPEKKSQEKPLEPTEVKSNAIDTSAVDLPAGSVREKYEENPALEKVTIADNQGNVTLQGTLLNNKKEGAWIEFNTNGTAKKITPYVNGKKEGWYVELNTNGQFTKKILYRNNLRHGLYREYNYSNVKEERFYQNDKLEGSVKVYYDNGKVMEEGNYKNGTREGVSKWYDQNGKLTIEYTYMNGELVNK